MIKDKHMLEQMEWGVMQDCRDFDVSRNHLSLDARLRNAIRAHALTWRARHPNTEYMGAVGFVFCLASAFAVGVFWREIIRLIF